MENLYKYYTTKLPNIDTSSNTDFQSKVLSSPIPKSLLSSGILGESISAENKAKDGEDFDFDAMSTMYLDLYDIDDGKNINANGNADYEEPVVPVVDDDDGVYNFGDIDLGDETAVGDYDFGDLLEGVEEGSVAVDDYDFNILSGDATKGYDAGTEFILDNTPIFATQCSITTNTYRSGSYVIYSNIVVDSRIRITKMDDGVGQPARSSGWVNLADLAKLEKISVGDVVLVEGNVYTYANGSGGYILKTGEIMYVVGVEDSAYDYPYALASSPTNTRQGYASADSITKISDV